MACAPPSRSGPDTLTRLHRCIAESRPQDDEDLSKAFPSAATPDLDAALAAVRRYGATAVPATRPTPPRAAPAPAKPPVEQVLPKFDLAKAQAEYDYFHGMRHLRPADPPRLRLDHGVRNYWDFRDRVAADIRAQRVSPIAAAIVQHSASKFNLAKADAAEWTELFMHALRYDMISKRSSSLISNPTYHAAADHRDSSL